MHIIVIGLNYKTAPVEIRERLSFAPNELESAMKALKSKKSILENVIISTCNRTEIYAVVDQLHTGRYYTKTFLSEWFEIDKDEFTPYLSILEDDGAINHLFNVTCGLNSMILGETQILGQVRTSFLEAQEYNTIGTIFNQLFKQAVTLAKRAHFETEIGSNAVSVSYAAVELAKKVFGNLSKKNVLIFGAGKMGELAVQNLYGSGVENVIVINRTFDKAKDLAERFSGQAKSIDELENTMLEADIIISSTGAKGYVITKNMVEEIDKLRKGRPLFMVDIAVPRDIDPAIADLENVFLYDIDDLEGIVQANLQERKLVAEKIELMIEAEMVAFKQWMNTLGVVPIIAALRQKAATIQAETMQSIERKMDSLSDHDRKILSKHTKSIVNQLLRDPILKVKELAAEPNAKESLELFMKIFDIEEAVQADMKSEHVSIAKDDLVKIKSASLQS